MKRAPLFLLALLSLCGCEETKKQFDFSKKAPDEFAVVKRAPLEMPPDYNLRPPRPGAPRPQELSPEEEAQAAVTGTKPSGPVKGFTPGESALLQESGAINADPSIRAVIDSETARIEKEETPTIDRIMKVTGKKIEAPAKVVDPIAETERIKQNKAQGKPVGTGKTPSIDN